MDDADRRILEVLRGNGRASYAEIARSIGLSSSAVHERVNKMEATGVIEGYRAVVAPSALGQAVTALIGIEPGETSDEDAVVRALDAMPEVESCYGVAGDEAFVVAVRVPTVDQLHLLLGRIRSVPGVARTRTTVVLATWFEGRPVP